jgi:hypothetical protein
MRGVVLDPGGTTGFARSRSWRGLPCWGAGCVVSAWEGAGWASSGISRGFWLDCGRAHLALRREDL